MSGLELPIMLLLFTVYVLYCVSFNFVEAEHRTCISYFLFTTFPLLVVVLDILFIVASARRRTQGRVGVTGWGIENESLFD